MLKLKYMPGHADAGKPTDGAALTGPSFQKVNFHCDRGIFKLA